VPGVCCASHVKPKKIADQAIFYPSNSESSPIIGDFLRHQAQKIHKCNRLPGTFFLDKNLSKKQRLTPLRKTLAYTHILITL
jgi:hypothetical protein